MPGLVLWPCLRITEGRTVQAAGCSRHKLAATRSIAAFADVGSIPIPGSIILTRFLSSAVGARTFNVRAIRSYAFSTVSRLSGVTAISSFSPGLNGNALSSAKSAGT